MPEQYEELLTFAADGGQRGLQLLHIRHTSGAVRVHEQQPLPPPHQHPRPHCITLQTRATLLLNDFEGEQSMLPGQKWVFRSSWVVISPQEISAKVSAEAQDQKDQCSGKITVLHQILHWPPGCHARRMSRIALSRRVLRQVQSGHCTQTMCHSKRVFLAAPLFESMILCWVCTFP